MGEVAGGNKWEKCEERRIGRTERREEIGEKRAGKMKNSHSLDIFTDVKNGRLGFSKSPKYIKTIS